MIFRSAHPDVTIPPIELHEYVLRHAPRLANKPALIDGPSGRTVTYGQLEGGSRACAAGLAARGFKKGDVFAIYCPNLPEYAIAFLGVSTAGGTCTTVNPLYAADELANQLDDSRARFVLTIPPFLGKAQEAASKSKVKEIFVIGEAAGATPFASLLSGGTAPPATVFDPANDLVALPYLPATAGLPKGVMLTHRNLVANLCQYEGMESFESYRENDVAIAVLPFFHVYSMLFILFFGPAQGATLITVPSFELEEFLATVQKYKVTFAPLLPPIILGLAKHPAVDNYDVSSLRMILSAASPLGEAVALEASRRLHCKIAQGYGMTEASLFTHLSPCKRWDFKMASLGWVVPNTEVMIVDPVTLQPQGVGQPGEL